jgi:N-acetylglucosamine kinase-like BadF-type ATPase
LNIPRYFLGLDGGATKTHCVLYDMAEDRLEFVTGGATNHEVLPSGMEGLADALSEIIAPLVGKMGISLSDIDFSAFGMGGVDTPIQHETISAIISEMGFRQFVLSNDAYLGIKAECGGTGICAVNGSGYSVVGINTAGEMLQIGGHNDMTGDKGGGTYLVPSAVRSVYSELFKDGPQTAMTAMFSDWIGTYDPAEFCQSVATRIMSDSVSAYNAVSKILYRAASVGDGEALRILTECGEDYALSIRCVAKRLGMEKPIDVVLVGSQFTKCEDMCTIDTMRRKLDPDDTGRDFRLHVISTEPVAGALLWALELAGIKPEAGAQTELCGRVNAAGRH